MITVRVVGVVLGTALVLVTVVQRRRGRGARGDTLLWVAVSMGIIVLSTVPVAVDIFASLFRLPNRLSGVLVAVAVAFAWLLARTRARLPGFEHRFGRLIQRTAARYFSGATGRRGGESPVAIIVPACDEAEAIEGVLRDLPELENGFRVDPIVVGDGGIDYTKGIVLREGYSVAAHAVNRGQGDALRTEFSIPLYRGAHIVVTMDAERQHRADQLESIISPIVVGEAEYVQESRPLSEYAESGSIRSSGIRTFTRLINLLSGTMITSFANGFRAMRADELALMDLREDRYNGPRIILEAALRVLFKIEGCPSTYSDELTGSARSRCASATRWASSTPPSGSGSDPDAPSGSVHPVSPLIQRSGAASTGSGPVWHHPIAPTVRMPAFEARPAPAYCGNP